MTGCGPQEIEVAKDSPDYRGAVLFQERCSGCHTLTPAAAAGSKPVHATASNDRTNGPNLDQRAETVDDVLFAIRNGGFSGAIMPANIVVGENAQDVADFVAKYAGGAREAPLGGESSTETDTAPATPAEQEEPNDEQDAGGAQTSKGAEKAPTGTEPTG
jgi:hypothetical protein